MQVAEKLKAAEQLDNLQLLGLLHPKLPDSADQLQCFGGTEWDLFLVPPFSLRSIF